MDHHEPQPYRTLWSSSSPSSPISSFSSSTSSSASPVTANEGEEPPYPTLRLYNSRTRTKEIFRPQQLQPQTPLPPPQTEPPHKEPQPKVQVTMYTCGPTVYDAAHVGNFRAFLTYDLLKRVFLYLGYDVLHVCNLTDIDDKIIVKANQLQLTNIQSLTEHYAQVFARDAARLNILPASHSPRATQHVAGMLHMIQVLAQTTLLSSSSTPSSSSSTTLSSGGGLAYETADGSWYFDTTQQPNYGRELIVPPPPSPSPSPLQAPPPQSQASPQSPQSPQEPKPQKKRSSLKFPSLRSSSSSSSSSTNAATATTETNDHNNNHQQEEDTEENAEEPGKKHPADFCLWKAYKPGIDRDDAVWSSQDFIKDHKKHNTTTTDTGVGVGVVRVEKHQTPDTDPVVPFTLSADIPIRRGRPGWHLECSAMCLHYFGTHTLDVHGGGIDLKFPHHENEIAQSQGYYSFYYANASNQRMTTTTETTNDRQQQPHLFCNCWFHNGFVNMANDEKMSKSLGNGVTLSQTCPQPLQVRAYRFLVIASQYRNALTFTETALFSSVQAVRRIDHVKRTLEQALAALREQLQQQPQQQTQQNQNQKETQTQNQLPKPKPADSASATSRSSRVRTAVRAALDQFERAIRDDLAMPRATAALFRIVKLAEQQQLPQKQPVSRNGHDVSDDIQEEYDCLLMIYDALLRMDTIFGIFYDPPPPTSLTFPAEGVAGSSSSSSISNASSTTTTSTSSSPTSSSANTSDTSTRSSTTNIPQHIQILVTQRSAAKRARDYVQADALRSQIHDLGYIVQDVSSSSTSSYQESIVIPR